MRILYIEDDRDSRELIVVLLGQLGYEVVGAARVIDGIAQARSDHFDLIILDNWLDEGSGIDACQQIRSFDNETPIIFYSAAAYDSDIKSAMSAGAQAYVIKPSVQALEETVKRLLHP